MRTVLADRVFGAQESAAGASESTARGRCAERSRWRGKLEVSPSRHRDSEQLKKGLRLWVWWVIPLLLLSRGRGRGCSAEGRDWVTMSEDKTTWRAEEKLGIG
jgi:hypothetical protein